MGSPKCQRYFISQRRGGEESQKIYKILSTQLMYASQAKVLCVPNFRTEKNLTKWGNSGRSFFHNFMFCILKQIVRLISQAPKNQKFSVKMKQRSEKLFKRFLFSPFHHMNIVRNLEKTIRISLKSWPSEQFHQTKNVSN